jgi:hypothetical protein
VIDWQQKTAACSVLLNCVLLAKLYASELTSRYRFFSFYLLFETVCGSLLLMVGRGTTLYGRIWLMSKPLSWVLCMLVLLEIYALVMANYPGIASLMRWAVTLAAGASAAFSVVSLALDFRNPNEPFPLLRYAFAVQRTVDGTMAISVLVPLLFMLRFPVRLSRNVVAHCALFSGVAGVEGGALFARNWFGRQVHLYTNLTITLGTIVCLLLWIVLLNPEREQIEQPVGPRCSPEMERVLLDQLQAFNAVLLKRGQTQFLG